MIQMTLNVIGAVPVDFEQYRYIKISALVDAKTGFGSVSQIFKYQNLDDLHKFKHIKPNTIYPAVCKGRFVSNGSDNKQEFVIDSIEFEQDLKKPA